MERTEKWIGTLLGGKQESAMLPLMQQELSAQAKALLEDCFSDIPEDQSVTDYHTHFIGIGTPNPLTSECRAHKYLFSPWHPYYHIKLYAGMSSCSIKNIETFDEEYLDRLVALVSYNQRYYNWGRHTLLALDKWYDKDGKPQDKKTGVYVPNSTIDNIVSKYPDLFEMAASIHPYRKDAIDELDYWAQRGVKVIKWLAPSQGIDASSDKCIPFYDRMARHNMTLIYHGGKEHSIDLSNTKHSLGNPLLIRPALEMGVKVVVAHAASLGMSADLDSWWKKPTSNFDLFMRLFTDRKYKNNLFTDLSAITQPIRCGKPLKTLLDTPELHSRIMYGSDYPLPAMNVTISTRWLECYGYITSSHRKCLNEIYRYNPALFDFALKRCLSSPDTGNSFPPSVFTQHPAL